MGSGKGRSGNVETEMRTCVPEDRWSAACSVQGLAGQDLALQMVKVAEGPGWFRERSVASMAIMADSSSKVKA